MLISIWHLTCSSPVATPAKHQRYWVAQNTNPPPPEILQDLTIKLELYLNCKHDPSVVPRNNSSYFAPLTETLYNPIFITVMKQYWVRSTRQYSMMTSSNGNIFRVTGHLCGKFTGPRWRGALMFSLIYVWINDWANNREAGDLRRQHGHYDVIVMANPATIWDPEDSCSIRYPPQIHLTLKSREISFVHNFSTSHQIVWKLCTEPGGMTAMFCVKIQNDSRTEKGVIDGRSVARYEIRVRLGGISYMATVIRPIKMISNGKRNEKCLYLSLEIHIFWTNLKINIKVVLLTFLFL